MSHLLRGKPVADEVYAELAGQIGQLQKNGIQLTLAVVMVEGDPASVYYMQAKRRVAERIGVGFRLHAFPADCEEAELLACIDRLNADPGVHGIMLELPLPERLPARRIMDAIAPLKDVDGVTPANRLALLTGEPGLAPATPQACIRLARHYGYALSGRNVTLIGRGQTVGMPLFHLLQREQATVTVCHSRTRDLKEHLAHADIAFVAVGVRGLVTGDMLHPELVLVDAGMNELPDGSIAGDVDPAAGAQAEAFTPTPGGIGTLTTALLFANVYRAYELQNGSPKEGSA